jgi:SAM-dependent methyltransferase
VTECARPEGQASWLTQLPRTVSVGDRVDWLVEFARGKRVAHVGFADVGCELTNRILNRQLHARLADASADLVGLDISADAVAEAEREGLQAHVVDCTDLAAVSALDIGQFDCVILGEVIEHVSNPGLLIDSMAKLVEEQGTLLITTPNARRPIDVLLAAFGRELVHPDHVALYSPRTITRLLEVHGWEVTAILTYVNERPPFRRASVKARLLRVVPALTRVLAQHGKPYVADGLIVLAGRSGAGEVIPRPRASFAHGSGGAHR